MASEPPLLPVPDDFDDILDDYLDDDTDLAPERTCSAKVLLLSLVVLVITVPSLALLWRYQALRHADILLARAEKAESEEDWKKAAKLLKLYNQYRPDDVEPIERLAVALDKTARARQQRLQAAMFYQRVLVHDPDRMDLRIRIAEINLRYYPEIALEDVGEILEQDAGNVRALRIQASALDQLFIKSTEAKKLPPIQAFKTLLAYDPTDVRAATRLAELYWTYGPSLAQHLGEPLPNLQKHADEVMDALVEADKESIDARLARFEYRRKYRIEELSRNRLDDDIRVVLEMAPSNGKALYSASTLFIRSDDGLVAIDKLELAQKYLETAIEDDPTKLLPHLALARVIRALGKAQDAHAVIERALKQHPNNVHLIGLKARYLIQMGDFKSAKVVLEQFQGAIADNRVQLERSGIRGRSHFRMQQIDARVQMANWFLDIRNPDHDEKAAYEQVEKLILEDIVFPDFPEVFVDLGQVYARLQKWNQAVGAFRKAVGGEPSHVQTRLLLIEALRRAGDNTGVVTELGTLARRDLRGPYRQPVLFQYAKTLLATQLRKRETDWEWAEFDRTIGILRAEYSDQPLISLLEIEASYVRAGFKNSKKVSDLLREAEEKHVESATFWRGAAQLYSRMGDKERANSSAAKFEAITQNALAGASDSAKIPNSDPVLKQVKEYIKRADLALAEGDPSAAIKVLKEWADRFPQSAQPRLRLLKVASDWRRLDELKKLELELKELEGESGQLWRVAKVRWLLLDAEAGRASALIEAQRHVREWMNGFANSSQPHISAALIAEARGDFSSAISEYRIAFRNGDRTPQLAHSLLGLLLLTDQHDKAIEFARQLQDRVLYSATILPSVVDAYIKAEKANFALRLTQEAFAKGSASSNIHVAAAKAYIAMGQQGEAVQSLENAVMLDSSNVANWIALLFVRMNQTPLPTSEVSNILHKTVVLLDAHKNRLPGNWRQIVVARCLELSGDLIQAELYYRGALQSSDDGSARLWIPAEATLTRLIANRPVLNDPVLWALGKPIYRLLALIDACHSSADKTNKRMLDGDVRLESIALLNSGKIDEAIASFSRIPEAQLSTHDCILLARVMRLNSVQAASDWYAKALAKNARPRALAEIAKFALSTDQKKLAKTTLEQFARDHNDDLSASLRVSLMILQNRPEQAVQWAETNVVALRMNQRAAFVRMVAALLADANHHQLALGLIDRSLARTPLRELETIRLLSKIPEKRPEAMKRCESLANQGSKLMAASFAIQIAELPPHMPDLFTKADKLISALDSEQAASSPFQADLFRLREVQGRFDEAGRIAQKALTVEPRNIVHLNNYAWAVAAYKNAGIMAMGKINQALRFGGPLENMIDSKAIALLSASQPAEAISTLEAMIVNSPDYPNSSFWLHLAKAHQTSGNQEKADLYRQNAGKKPFSLPFDQKIAKNN